jgi:phage terminase Nu1 subunit (DNA packaging protein)
VLTQQEIAEHLDMSQQAVSQLLADLGIDWKAVSLDEVRVAYIRRLREIAAGRAALGDLDLATERARLAREQADKIAMQNAVTRGELTSTVVLEQVLASAASKIAGILDAIPGLVRRRVPLLQSGDIDMIAGEVAKARNTVAAMSLVDLVEEAVEEAAAKPAQSMEEAA